MANHAKAVRCFAEVNTNDPTIMPDLRPSLGGAGVSQEDGLPPAARRWVMLCVLSGIVLASLDSAIANIALPTIARDLVISDTASIWVVNGYQLALTICLLPAAALAESWGIKRVYAFGLSLFTLASLGCALSPNLDILVTARVLQGAGGACTAALAGALVRVIYPRRLLGGGFALVALAVATSGALGPTIAALILSIASWPWLFLINVPLGLAIVPLFLRVAPAGNPHRRPFDAVGVLLNALAFGLVVVGVGGLGRGNAGLAVSELVTGCLCFALLIRQQMRQPVPLLPLDLLRIPLFALSVGTSICSYSAQILAYVSLPFFFETVLQRSTVETGLLVTPWPLFVAIAAPVAGRLTARYPASILGSIGLAVLCIGLLLLAALPASPTDWNILWRMGLCGVGFGFFQTPNNTTLMTAGPASRSGAASGMVAVARAVGWSLGSGLVALIFGLSGRAAPVICLECGALLAGVGALVSYARHYRLPGGSTKK